MENNIKISIIIPTHNRAESLRNVIESVLLLKDEAEFEFVVVDNNSNDSTKQVIESYAPFAKYVFEGRTSFTMARKAGGSNAAGDILLYLDDDVIVRAGSLRKIVEIFTTYPDCGVIAGRIDPKYMEVPPAWTLACQKSFNGWSLYNPETYKFLRNDFQEVKSAAGPMMAITKAAYDMVGGFPPDTIGVETNKGPQSFNKLYIGPGDYGLCHKVRKAGYKIYYSIEISVYHVIPPVRFTISFWRSRMIGEGYHEAITQRGFFHLKGIRAYLKLLRFKFGLYWFERRLLARLGKPSANPTELVAEGMFPEELWVFYYKAYLDMDRVLRNHPGLWEFLWNIGEEGINDDSYDHVIKRLPNDYKHLVSNEIVYNPTPINSRSVYETIVKSID